MLINTVTAPTDEPLEPDDVKSHCIIDDDALDLDLQTYIASAREEAATVTGRQIMPATLELILDGFPSCGEFRIPKPPLIEVLSVKYLDTNGVEQTMDEDDYVVDILAGETCEPSFLRLAYGLLWPTVQPVPRSVKVRFRAGYVRTVGAPPDETEEANVPKGIIHSMLVGVAESVKNKEESIQGTITSDAAMTMKRLLSKYVLNTVWE